MRHELKTILVMLALLLVLTVIAAIVIHNAEAKAETLPSPDASNLLALTGGLRLSDTPMDLYVAECLRVDLVSAGTDGAWACLTLPYVPASITGVLLFDGWHMIHGVWQQTGEATLRLRFWPEDVARLDGTVGIYLVILAEGNNR